MLNNFFEAIKLIDFLEVIIKFSFVLGFLPILSFLLINLNVPIFFKFNLFFLIVEIKTISKSLINFFDKFNE